METLFDVAHGDVGTAEGRTGETGGDDANGGTGFIVDIDDDSAFTGGGALLDGEAYATLGEGLGGGGELGEDGGGAIEVGGCGVATVLADDPAQRCAGGSLGGGDVVAVETHAGFQTEGVAGC